MRLEWAVRLEDNTLTHYGVKGMRWGVRKEPETKGRKTKSSGLSDTKLNSGSVLDFISNLTNKDIGSIKDKAIRTNVGVVKIDGFDTKQKKVADNTIELIKNKLPDRYASAEEAQKKLDQFEQDKYTMAYTRGKDQTYLVNHDGPSNIRLINCFECSMAYEMRNRGYNVQAKEMDGGWSAEVMHAFDIKDGFKLNISLDRSYSGDKVAAAKEAYNQMAEQCKSFGDGARGCLGVQWANTDGGHSMYWVVENGEFKIIDAQDSRRNGYEVFMSPADAVDSEITVYRLDNAELLPGVTDFVEPYSAVTEEEKNKASKKIGAKTLDKIKSENKKNEGRKLVEDEQRKAMEQIEAGRTSVEKAIRKVKKVTNTLVANGKMAITRFLKDPFNTKKKKKNKKTSNVTWEVS